MKANPPSLEEMLGWTAVVSVFHAQQLVNGWQRAYGSDHVRDVQAEVDRRRRRLVANEPGAAAEDVALSSNEDQSAFEEANHLAELERGYRRDRA
jgi:hypothetical protein